jgi:hypothetical protein
LIHDRTSRTLLASKNIGAPIFVCAFGVRNHCANQETERGAPLHGQKLLQPTEKIGIFPCAGLVRWKNRAFIIQLECAHMPVWQVKMPRFFCGSQNPPVRH